MASPRTRRGPRPVRVRWRIGAAGGLALALVSAALGVPARPAGAARGHPPSAEPVVVAPVPVLPAHAVALGAVAPASPVSADVVLEPRDPAGLAALATAVSTPGTSLHGDYRTPAELRAEFSPSTAEVARVEALLSRLGLSVRGLTPDRLTIRVSATAATMGRALGTRFERYRLPGGRVAVTLAAPATLPGPLGEAVASVVGLSDIYTYRPLDVIPPRGAGAPAPCSAAEQARQTYGGYTPSQLAGAYGMNHLYAAGDIGSGVTVGVVEFERNAASDIKAYESCFHLTTKVTYVKVDGGAGGPAFGSGEAALDIEDVAGLADGVHVDVYQAPNSNSGVLDEFQWIVDHPVAEVVTNSWGECEQALGANMAEARRAAQAESTIFEYGAAEGQTWLSAAGDWGSSDCYGDIGLPSKDQTALTVDDPGSQPYVTSVGGTRLRIGAHREVVWNDSFGAGGGGISSIWAMPSYQAAARKSLGVIGPYSSGAPCGAAAGYCREVPDVTADADPLTGYLIRYAGYWQAIGGTSAAAPLWAAVVALTEATPACGGRRVGLLNPVLYEIGSSKHYASSFHDITIGTNDVHLLGETGRAYPATTGYDMASGLGSPIVSSPSGAGLAASICAYVKVEHPAVARVSPGSGPAAGGNLVTIDGYGFTGVTAVYFGSHRATFRVLRASAPAPTTIRAVAPAGNGTVYVTVVGHRGTSARVAVARYTYQG